MLAFIKRLCCGYRIAPPATAKYQYAAGDVDVDPNLFNSIGCGFISVCGHPDLQNIVNEFNLNDKAECLQIMYDAVTNARSRLQNAMGFDAKMLHRAPKFLRTFEEWLEDSLPCPSMNHDATKILEPLIQWFERMHCLKANLELARIGRALQEATHRITIIRIKILQEAHDYIEDAGVAYSAAMARRKAHQHNMRVWAGHLNKLDELSSYCIAFDVNSIQQCIVNLRNEIQKSKYCKNSPMSPTLITKAADDSTLVRHSVNQVKSSRRSQANPISCDGIDTMTETSHHETILVVQGQSRAQQRRPLMRRETTAGGTLVHLSSLQRPRRVSQIVPLD